MSSVKRQRDEVCGNHESAPSSAEPSYLSGLPEGLAELADVQLLVEGQQLPVHSYILTSGSPVFVTAVTAARDGKQLICEVPLQDECKQDVMTVLKYLDQESLVIESIADAEVLAKFAHKFSMDRLLELSSDYMVEHLDDMLSTTTVFRWAEFAEDHQLRLLLARCEHYIVLNYHEMAEEDKQLSILNHDSLLRIMNGIEKKSTGIGQGLKGLIYCKACRAVAFKKACCCAHDHPPRPTAVLNVKRLKVDAECNCGCQNSTSQHFLEWQNA